MIPDDQLQLLTDAVDGELSAPQERALKVLLASSPAARDLYKKLCGDRDRLKAMPRVAPPPDLRARILAALPAPTPIIAPRRDPAPAARPWLPLALAASVMIGLSASSFWFFLREGNRPATATNGRPVKPTASGAGGESYAHVLPSEHAPPPSVPVAVDDAPNAVAHDHPRPPEFRSVEAIPAPRPVTNLNASPLIPDAPPFDLVQVRVPLFAQFGDMDQESVQQKLVAELGRDPAFRIDVFVRDAARGGEAFLAAAKATGVTVFADAVAADRIKRRLPGSLVVYADSLTPAEVRDLFVKLAAEDAKVTQRTFDSLHLVAATAGDQKELKDILGFDPGPWKRSATPAPVEPKSISAGTADQLAKSVSTSGPKAVEKPALMMPFGPTASRTPPLVSKELKQYSEKRGERKPNTVPVMIVIRIPG